MEAFIYSDELGYFLDISSVENPKIFNSYMVLVRFHGNSGCHPALVQTQLSDGEVYYPMGVTLMYRFNIETSNQLDTHIYIHT